MRVYVCCACLLCENFVIGDCFGCCVGTEAFCFHSSELIDRLIGRPIDPKRSLLQQICLSVPVIDVEFVISR